MQTLEPTCDSCKWLSVIPFAGTICTNCNSDYDTCEIDPDNDVCIEYEELE